MLVSIYTNHVEGGWKPEQDFLGGSEEAVVLFSSTLVKVGYEVEVYSSIQEKQNYNDVLYLPRNAFDFKKKYETLISFKDNAPWRLNVQADKKIHWSTAVEDKWSDGVLSKIDNFVCISNYHLNRVPFVGEKGIVIHLGIDTESIQKNKTPKKKKTILYCSSPDRGLQTLLSHWHEIQGYELIITYRKMFEVNLPNVKHIGAVDKDTFEKIIWSCEYWIHTLNNPDAELFCLNAIKARATETKAIINTIEGGLQDTVMDYIPFSEFLKGSTYSMNNKNCNTGIRTWEEIIRSNWLPIIGE